MNEETLRALIRETIARVEGKEIPTSAPATLNVSAHPSHYQYALPPSGGPCLIEPGVQCNHCGYCQSHGH